MDWLVGNFKNGKSFLDKNYNALEEGEGFWAAYKQTRNITVKTEEGEGVKIVSGQVFGAIEEEIENVSDKEVGARCLRSDGSFVKVSDRKSVV